MSSYSLRLSQLKLSVLALLWLGAAGTGVSLLSKYALTPGKVNGECSQWPTTSKLSLQKDVQTLVVFLHPRCPCSRATIQELAITLANCQKNVETQVVVYKPVNSGDDWGHTDLWRAAESIPGVKMVMDIDGTEAKRFSATTSGHSLLYDPEGKLLFSGGITGARGHEGENEGRIAISTFISGCTSKVFSTPVYGCPL